MTSDELPITRAELARRARVSLSTIDRARKAGLPCHYYGRRSPRFYLSESLAWLAQYGGREQAELADTDQGALPSDLPPAQAGTTTEGRSYG